MDPVRILAWLVLGVILLKPALLLLVAAIRLFLHYGDRSEPFDKYQAWVSPFGTVHRVNDIGERHVVVSATAMNMDGVHYSHDEWRKIVRREKLSLQ